MAHELYLTYQEYKSYGGELSETAFIPLEFKSRKRIDYLTDSRVQNMAAVPAAVKLCMYVLIGMESSVGRSEQAASPSVSSFNTDGYSETYSQAMDADTASAQMDALTKEYLYGEKNDNGTPLLYRGLDL
jgi:hypothetical protein